MKKGLRVLLMLLLALAVAVAAVGCGGQKPAGESKSGANTASGGQDQNQKMKVAFVYVGPVGDAGWSWAHDQGRKYLAEKLPWVETTYMENVPEGADAERVLTELAEQGNKIIFATSFGYMDYVINVAKKYPNVIFMHCSGYKTAENVGTYFGAMEEARYLSGMVAGKMTKKNVLGFVAAHPIPEVIRGINAFTLGARSVNPNVKVKVVWTNTWYDPAAEKQAALSLLDAGADVIAQHQDTPGPQQAAQERGAYGIGYDSDMSQFAPNATLTSPVWNWGPYYVKIVEAVKNGTWKPEQYYGTMKDGIVDLAPFNKMVPQDVRDLVEKKKQEIIDGKFFVFQGPIKDQSGKIRVQEGQKMSQEDILGFNWFVEGVEGEIPK
ncbi:BMP family ABC transporter substrate-binding protein [Neomoorella thermoacetica]|nr:BMP family ABC transporter substrate-binding protein [Moorella thermoacetica]AKX94775.1 purine-binding protein precursor [Moorella thermoacetica]AKX97407.1 purine-binding protein precursor [Moorella thermoacetica]AOQ24911.1 Purine-binding protein precursor [Moorella thermoacetica]OIQ54652.1 purine-binding protein precursor [Moorella thermoacetica]OIQ57174.1 purine-binding protein precursor [Moorella thermoacetica]